MRSRALSLVPARRSAPREPTAPRPGPSDAELVAQARLGDRAAREAIFRRHVEGVAATSLRLLGDHADSEDVVQETFLDAFEQLGKLDSPSSLRSWLIGIAVHKVHRRFRRRKLLRWLGLDRGEDRALLGVRAAEGSSPELHLELLRLGELLKSLPDADRAAWLLRYVEGYQVAQVAELCRCGLTTAKRRIARADAAVRAHVQLEDEVDHGAS